MFLVFVSFFIIVLFGFFFLPDFAKQNGVIQAYNKFKKAGPEIFIPAPPVAEKRNDDDRLRLAEKIRSDVDLNLLEKPQLQEPDKIPIVPLPQPNRHHAPGGDKTTHNGAGSAAAGVYDVDGTDEDPATARRRDKVKEVSRDFEKWKLSNGTTIEHQSELGISERYDYRNELEVFCDVYGTRRSRWAIVSGISLTVKFSALRV